MTKNVATKSCSRRTGSTCVYWPAEASSKVSRIGLRGSFAPRATWSTSASPRDRGVARAVQRVHLRREDLGADDVGAVLRAVGARRLADLVVTEDGDAGPRRDRGDVGGRRRRRAGRRVRRGTRGRVRAPAPADEQRERRQDPSRSQAVQATAYSAAASSSSSCACSKRLWASAAVLPIAVRPDAAELVQRAEHVEDDAAAVGGQPRQRGQAQQAAVAERAQARRLEMVGRDVVARRAARGGERRRVGVVDAAGQQLQRRQRVRGAAAAQVDLDRVRLPVAVVVARDDVVDSRTAPRAGVDAVQRRSGARSR